MSHPLSNLGGVRSDLLERDRRVLDVRAIDLGDARRIPVRIGNAQAHQGRGVDTPRSGAITSTETPTPSSSSRSWSGVPARIGNVP